jgi:hypothetical protein
MAFTNTEILNAAQAGLFGVLPTELGGATSLGEYAC